MAAIGNGYGSECHLLRWMGRHRQAFDHAVLKALGVAESRLEWKDFAFDATPPRRRWHDAELKGLDIPDEPALDAVKDAWGQFWPLGAGIMNWDAVGRLWTGNGYDLVLVEAKANTEEIRSVCGAKNGGAGRQRIEAAFRDVISSLGAAKTPADWMDGYYQAANRIAVLWFLQQHGIAARLLFMYFTGDRPRSGVTCPTTDVEWASPLREQGDHLGISGVKHAVLDRVHKVFLPVC